MTERAGHSRPLRPIAVPRGFPGRVGFVKSAEKLSQAPHTTLPEVCFCGRSNVGKSTLLNVLCNRRQLARVSSTPGRTRLINFFNVQDTLSLVDLPGYGWARVPREMKARWGQTVQEFLEIRHQLCLALMLVDIRRDPREEEKQLLSWFQHRGLPVLLVATKSDKLATSRRKARRRAIATELGVNPADVVLFSGPDKTGRDAVWGTILAHVGHATPDESVSD